MLLHEPDGHEAWNGEFRLVTLARAELEPEMAGDPLLPEVSWSWLTGALDGRGAGHHDPERHGLPGVLALLRRAGRAAGRHADRDPRVVDAEGPGGGGPDAAAHMAAWCDLLCACAGLAPADGPEARARGTSGVVPLPKRRT